MRPLHFLFTLMLVLVWGCNFVVMREGLGEIPPFTLCLLRLGLAAIPAVFFVRRPALPWRSIVIFGTLMFLLQFMLIFFGLALGLSAGLMSVCVQVHIFYTIGLAAAFLGERPAKFQIAGAVLAFIGLLTIGLHTGGDVTLPGMACGLLASLSWAVGNVYSKRMPKVDMFAMVVWGSLICLPPLFALAWMIDGPALMMSSLSGITWRGAGAVAYMVYPATLGGFSFWSWLVTRYPTATVAPMTLMVPVIGFAASAVVFGEAIEPWKIVATLLVISGLCVNMFGPRLLILLPSRSK